MLRGQVRIEFEPVFARNTDVPAPYLLDNETARQRNENTLQQTLNETADSGQQGPDQDFVEFVRELQRQALGEAAVCFAAMIYGWSFQYEIGERARNIPEEMELTPLGEISWGDPRLFVTDAKIQDMRFYLWADYRPSQDQLRRLGTWRAGRARNIQATGYGPLGAPVEAEDWHAITKEALEDAARAGIRAMLRGSERNRPKEARGFIALAEFPSYRMEKGRWAALARFHVEVTEIIPFAAY